MEQRTTVIRIDGRSLAVAPGVFDPVLHLSGPAVVEMLDDSIVPPAGDVFDLGTGCGLLAIRASRWAAQVVATDIDGAAVRCAQANVTQLGLDSVISVRHGSMFAAADGARFDLVVANPPYEIDSDATASDHSFASPDFFDELAYNLRDHLKPGAVMAMALPAPDRDPIEILRRAGYECEVWRSAPTVAGDMIMWRIAPSERGDAVESGPSPI